ncbi:hypothetical protein EAX61_09830 [Dokdonia sinensis]|uniref:Uncharacterized protein n=1 Tax=Dokdonia sinensis TaxID=2479847 RepID=A0A3M0G0X8_9FLAO|nr:hypothetical protein EAX61_09830 [Dokdonia sinensis]
MRYNKRTCKCVFCSSCKN